MDEKKQHVVVCFPSKGPRNHRGKSYGLICLSVDSLIKNNNAAACVKPTLLNLPFSNNHNYYLNRGMSFIITSTSRRLYFFGGLDELKKPFIGFFDREIIGPYLDNKVCSYDLHKLPQQVGTIQPCKDMIYGMYVPLVAQVGHDSVYLLNYGKNSSTGKVEFAFQEYNFMKNQWTLIDNVFNIARCDRDWGLPLSLHKLPHVVIGPKLHVSIGKNSSFAFDTISRVWEKSKLFETFWKTSGFSPFNFYGVGVNIWGDAPNNEFSKKRNREIHFGGPLFGFIGRAIFWKEKNILFGLHFAPNCPVVAFQLDDDGIKVVKSQPLSLDIFHLLGNPRLVDLGRDGYFGLVHTKSTNPYSEKMELVTFRVQVIAAPRDEDFLKCQVMSKNILVKNLPPNILAYCDAFCV